MRLELVTIVETFYMVIRGRDVKCFVHITFFHNILYMSAILISGKGSHAQDNILY